ncbi:MAG: RNA polymerase sigma factor [Fimbriiglobus sp.]
MPEAHDLVEHFFRHESARLQASLIRRFGAKHWNLVEDAVQGAMVRALTSWSRAGVPPNPTGWLYRAATHAVLDVLRRDLRWNSFSESQADPSWSANELPTPEESELQDDLLQMLFLCCEPSLPVESLVPLALKTLMGFSIAEIASALIQSEATIAKRITRAKQHLSETPRSSQPVALSERLPQVQMVIYLVFNEGYASSHPDKHIRTDLCEEAVRLAFLIAEHPQTRSPNTAAFLALLLFHSARLEERLNSAGELLLMAEQDRNAWDAKLLHEAYRWFRQATIGNVVSRYHAEAWIAAEHCRATSFAETDWTSIVKAYDLLIQLDPSPLHELNRAVAIAQRSGPTAGHEAFQRIAAEPLLGRYYLYHAVAGHLAEGVEDWNLAATEFTEAIRLAGSDVARRFLEQRRERVLARAESAK